MKWKIKDKIKKFPRSAKKKKSEASFRLLH